VEHSADEAASSRDSSGIRDFQLMILNWMRGNEVLVQDALRMLGADQAEMAAASRDHTERISLPGGGHFKSDITLKNAIALLGPPTTSETIEPPPHWSGVERLTKLTYQLPLWPELVFYLEGVPEVLVLHDCGFARLPRTPPAAPDDWEDLRPWAWLRDEVIERFGPPIEEGDIWPPYEEFKFQSHAPDGTSRQFWAIFSWNLLQQTRPA
jgi:hypothetical protein